MNISESKGFTIIELLIALALSAFIIMGVYSIFTGVLKTKEGLDVVNDDMRVIQSLQRIVARDMRMMSSGTVAELPADLEEEQIIFALISGNSLRFNKSMSVDIIYTLENETFYRIERKQEMNYMMKLPLLLNVTELLIENFDGREYTDVLNNNYFLFRFSFLYNNKPVEFLTGRLMDVK
ncbi:MAG: prepilin-type N-terminal cleavage/methylation domain-containing protein [Deferribacteraceae bacterium]|jgi:prepilin-type N-terminal cleavage/methylation domain-containing protein|nr:prepilin-type N-terminal cleavage/methylation domain-containing protein [Deferribacteraceae bacterium]